MKYVTYLTKYSGDLLPPFYIGSTSEKKALSGKYYGSVSSKKYKNIFNMELKNNKHLFSLEILSYHKERKEALEEELKIQIKKNVVKSDKYFNESLATINGFFGMKIKGKNHPRYGKKHTEESNNKNRISNTGKNHFMSKSIIQMDKDGGKIREFESINEASRILKIPLSNVSNVLNGNRKHAKGFTFKIKY